jgi:hypothetical protein
MAAGSGGYAGLSMAIIRTTPATAFKEAVCGRNPTPGHAVGQFAARINHPQPELAHVQRFSPGIPNQADITLGFIWGA